MLVFVRRTLTGAITGARSRGSLLEGDTGNSAGFNSRKSMKEIIIHMDYNDYSNLERNTMEKRFTNIVYNDDSGNEGTNK